ncbi:hypothetical protein [Metabacillus schmidteae]|uniref:hypothetical protein n=1 Tax=Metabacillus schmidteae TaxID=2730405 RepID=UPI00158B3FC0|nr:hypothetical protein [Metabacillus schmidteae]
MAFAVYFFISWLCIILFFIKKKTYSIVENTILFLFLMIVNMNWSWFIFDEFQFLKYSEHPMSYTAYLMNRSIIIPIIVLYCLNLSSFSMSVKKMFIHILVSSLLLLLLTFLSLTLNIITSENWNVMYDYLFFVLLHIACYLIHKWYHSFVIKTEVQTK